MLILMQYYEVPNDLSSLVNFLNRMAQFFEPLVFMRHFNKKTIKRKMFISLKEKRRSYNKKRDEILFLPW